jgi:hypothetical protein
MVHWSKRSDCSKSARSQVQSSPLHPPPEDCPRGPLRGADRLPVLDSGDLAHIDLPAHGGLYARLTRRRLAGAQQPLRLAGN